jgi:hypothetical protein
VRQSIDRFVESFRGREGVTPERAEAMRRNLDDTYRNLAEKKPHQLVDRLNPNADGSLNQISPEEKLNRTMANMDRIMNHDGTINGQQVHSKADQIKIAENIAAMGASQEDNGNQGKHNDCALQSKGNQVAETDIDFYSAKVADMATTGRATTFDGRTIVADPNSLRLDAESRAKSHTNQDANLRGGAQQIWSHFAGNAAVDDYQASQLVNDLQMTPGQRADLARQMGISPDQMTDQYINENYKVQYRQGDPSGDRNDTGERLVLASRNGGQDIVPRDKNGKVVNSPGVTSERYGTALDRIDGDYGSGAIDATVARRDNVTANGTGLQVFNGTADFQARAREYEERTGRTMRVGHFTGVQGHGRHSALISSSGEYNNSWGAANDRRLDMAGGATRTRGDDFDVMTDDTKRGDLPASDNPRTRYFDPGNQGEMSPEKKAANEDADREREKEENKDENKDPKKDKRTELDDQERRDAENKRARRAHLLGQRSEALAATTGNDASANDVLAQARTADAFQKLYRLDALLSMTA